MQEAEDAKREIEDLKEKLKDLENQLKAQRVIFYCFRILINNT